MASKKTQLSSNNLMIVMLLVTLLVLGLAGFAGKALFGSIRRDAKVVQKKQAADKQLDANVSAAPGLISSYNSMGDQNRVLSDALPTTVDYPSLLVILENMANSAGMKVKLVSPALTSAAALVPTDATAATGSDPTVAPAAQTYQFDVTVTGTYDGLLKVFNQLETSARPMRVQTVQITGSGNDLSADLSISTYYQAKGVLPFGEETVK